MAPPADDQADGTRHSTHPSGGEIASASPRYEIVRELGAGGMGVVFEARDRESGETLALKTLSSFDTKTLLRFKAEFRSLADFSHRNVVRLGELHQEGDDWFFTMELVPGRTIVEHVRDLPPNSTKAHPQTEMPDGSEGIVRPPRTKTNTSAAASPTTSDELAAYAHDSGSAPPSEKRHGGEVDLERLEAALDQLASGIAALHAAGHVHRDIKPSHVLVDGSGRVVILDMGIAGALSSGGERVERAVGTPAYMPPDEAEGAPPDPMQDWYAFGVLAYECVTGRLPFDGTRRMIHSEKKAHPPLRPSTFCPQLPRDLDTLISGLLDPDPSLRPTPSQVQAVVRGEEVALPSPRALDADEFVGRTGELQELYDALEGVRGGENQRILIHGEAGVGKTKLIRQLLEEIALSDTPSTIFQGRCFEQEAVPFKAFGGIVDQLALQLAEMSEDEVEALLPEHAAELTSLFPILRDVQTFAGLRSPTERSKEVVRSRAFEALRTLFRRLGERRVLVLIIDDVQWADRESFSLLRHVLAPPEAPRTLVIATARDELMEALDRGEDHTGRSILSTFDRLPLGRLSTEESRALVLPLLRDLPRTVDRVLSEGRGHPLHLKELVRHVRENPEGSAAVRLEEVLWARIDSLEPDAKRVLLYVALFGTQIGRDHLSMVAGIRRRECGRILRHLQNEQLVRLSSQSGRVTAEVYHGRVREAVDEFVAEERARTLHLDLARALFGNVPPGAVVRQLELARRRNEAAELALTSAYHLEDGVRFGEVAQLFADALRLGGVDERSRADVLRRQADAVRKAGRAREAAALYLEACEASQDLMLRLYCRRMAGELLILCGDVDRGPRELEKALKEAGVKHPPVLFMALVIPFIERRALAVDLEAFQERPPLDEESARQLDVRASTWRAMTLVHQIRAAYHLYGHAVEASRRGDRGRAIDSLSFAAVAYATLRGSKVKAETDAWRAQLLDAANDAPETTRRWVEVCDAALEGSLGGIESMMPRLTELERWYLSQTTQDIMTIVFIRTVKLESMRMQGLIAEWREYAEGVIREAQRTDMLLLETYAIKYSNMIWLLRDDPAGARRELDRPLWRSADLGFTIPDVFELRARIEIDLYEGDLDGILGRYTRQFRLGRFSPAALLPTINFEFGHLRCRILLAHYSGRGENRRIRRKLRRIIRRYVDEGNPILETRAILIEAAAEQLSGNPSASIPLLREAIRKGEACHARIETAAGKVRLGALSDDPDERAAGQEALAWLEGQGAARPERIVAVFAPGYDPRPDDLAARQLPPGADTEATKAASTSE